MPITIAQALFSLRPGSQWMLNGNSYAGLDWLDTTQTKPTNTQTQQNKNNNNNKHNSQTNQPPGHPRT
jgi:hypothetical protein